jgi:hypothetical protein
MNGQAYSFKRKLANGAETSKSDRHSKKKTARRSSPQEESSESEY